MKIIKKLIFFLLLLIVVLVSIAAIVGYTTYAKALKQKPLLQRVEEVTSKEHYIPFEGLPKVYVDAVVSTEDRRFYEHGPVDIISIARAITVNVKNKEIEEGGSTITQQVAKNIVFSQEKSVPRKLGEFFAAHEIEKNYTKDEILALYVNSAYFGDNYYGIYEASMGYYSKEPKDLDLSEASMLAGIPNAPSVYSPSVNPELAKERQEQVLDKMLDERYITKQNIEEVETKWKNNI